MNNFELHLIMIMKVASNPLCIVIEKVLIVVLGLILFALLPISCKAGDLPVGARPGAMGDAYVALSQDVISIYHNPAGLASLTGIGTEIFIGEEGFPLMDNYAVFYAKAQSSNDWLGTALIRQQREIDGTAYRSYQLLIPNAKRITRRITVGANLKILTQKVGTTAYKSKISADLGFLYDRGMIKIGGMVKNFPDPDMGSFPRQYSLALAFDLNFIRLEVVKSLPELDHFTLNDDDMLFGAEFSPLKFLSLRAGWTDKDGAEIISAGVGVSDAGKKMELSYCYRAESDDFDNGTHWLSYTYLLF